MKRPLDTIDKCTTCSTCVASCPVTRATRSFRGPKLTGPSSERFRRLTKQEIEALDYCSNCKNCDMSCPFGVAVSALNMLARGEQARHRSFKLRDWILAHGHTLAEWTRWTQYLPQSLVRFGMTNPLTRNLLHLFGIDRRAPLPVFTPQRFAQYVAKHQNPIENKQSVIFFPGCYINDYDAQVGLDVLWWLERAGYNVLVPSTECCGLPLVANGFLDEAQTVASNLCNALHKAVEQQMPILTACPSCSLMLRQEYSEFFTDLPQLQELRPLVQDVCDFLLPLCEEQPTLFPVLNQEIRALYHEPCHLKAQGIGRPGVRLLQHVGMTIQDGGGDCCGISGSYGFKTEKYDVAATVGAELFETLRNASSDLVLSECGTCRLQLQHHTAKKALHPLSFLRSFL